MFVIHYIHCEYYSLHQRHTDDRNNYIHICYLLSFSTKRFVAYVQK